MTDLPDFDQLKELAQTDPDTLLRIKKQIIDDFIASAPESHQARLRGIQWRIDEVARKAKSPMAACVEISGMLHASFDSLRDALNEITGNQHLIEPKKKPEGKVIGFARGPNE